MHLPRLIIFFFGLSARSIVAATSGSVVARNNDNVLQLTVHDYRAKSLRKRELPLAPIQEDLVSTRFSYIVNVTVAGQELALVLDTGSHITWVIGPSFICLDQEKVEQSSSQCMLGRPLDTSRSTTLQVEEGQFNIRYADNEFMQGSVVTTQVGIGGISRKQQPLSISHQRIGIVEKGCWFGDKVSSGLLGLAFPTSPTRFSILHTLFQEKSTERIFSLALTRPTRTGDHISLPAYTSGGVLAFGGIPDVPTDGRWVHTPLVLSSPAASRRYTIMIDGFDITPPPEAHNLRNYQKGGRYASSPQIMAIDSGSTMVQVPSRIAAYIASLFVPPAWQYHKGDAYYVDCTAKAPRVGIKIAGTLYYISHDDLISPISEVDDDQCQLEIHPSSREILLLGTPWLKNVLVAFSFTSMSEGFMSKTGQVSIAGREKY
ncbi:aspartic peptidase domain-containing protein [Ampelomyces quisqualis]|uniref:Aspartic peptidase domain-containing protein n=1 Tax=Ampelomyces quisqualis TaxID=50730 RepID=A0A6A5Q9Z0_AMPQU|nr:aspartic peptidase domain-containing protein [Ampelomyces quisqualis]